MADNNDISLQLYITAGVGYSAILLLLIAVIFLFFQVNSLSKKVHKLKEVSRFQYQSPEIHPNEELAKRGFRKFPSINSST